MAHFLYPSGLTARELLKAGCGPDIDCEEIDADDCRHCVLGTTCVNNMTDEEVEEVFKNILKK